MAAATIQYLLQRSQLQTDNWQFLRVFRVRIDVIDMAGVPDDRIFVYAREPVDPGTGLAADWFQAVASAVDMNEYPGDEPAVDGSTPFFRLNYIELDLRAAAEADVLWKLIQQEVCILCKALEAVQTLVVADTVWCCSPPDSTDSISTSESTSESASHSVGG